uniref:G-protein coupled receptors family 1 profile domain-containing protein n=1 Tax=Plectus sambesii TaxID=2011161 RepID=A0A914WST5_9BILA
MANDTFHAYNLTTNATIVTSVFDVEGDVIAYYRYLWTGLATIIANLFVLALIISDRGLRERLLLYAVLAVGDTLNGCYFGYANFNRLRQIYDGSFYILITKWDCAKKLYSFFQLSGTQFPALIALLISVERVLAVQKPLWFYGNTLRRIPDQSVVILLIL